jgi:carbon-monoxide dehydrogenase small subunit
VRIALTVNGVPVQRDVEERRLLTDFLRHDLGSARHARRLRARRVRLPCTVRLDGAAVRALPAARGAGRRLPRGHRRGPRRAGAADRAAGGDARHHGLQCGFCTPGI